MMGEAGGQFRDRPARLIPRVKTAWGMFGRTDVRARMKDGKSGWVVIEEREGAADRAARQEVARFVLLEGARPAAEEAAGGLLGQPSFTPPTTASLRSPP